MVSRDVIWECDLPEKGKCHLAYNQQLDMLFVSIYNDIYRIDSWQAIYSC